MGETTLIMSISKTNRLMPYFDPGNGTQVFIPDADWNRGTYRELLAILAELPEENLDQEVVIRDSRVEYPNNEFFPAQSIGWTGDDKFFITV